MSFKLVYPYFKENRLKIGLGISYLLMVDIFLLIIPLIIKKSIDIITYEDPDLTKVGIYSSIIIICGLLITFFRYFWRVYLIGASRYVERGLRDKLFSHVISLDSSFFDKVRTGDIMAHATSDLTHIRMAFGMGLVAFTDAVLLGSATISIMFYMNYKLTLLALLPLPAIAVITKVLGKKMHDYHTTAQESFSKLTENVRESFFGIRIIKVFNFEDYIIDKSGSSFKDYYVKNLKRAAVTSIIKPLMVLFLNLSLFIIIFYGGYLVMIGSISAGDLVAFMQYLGLLAWPVIALGWMTNLMQRGLASLKRIDLLLNEKALVQECLSPVSLDRFEKKIEFRDLSFSYSGMKKALDGISLDINKNEIVGITGPPGSGKSSLVSLIPRLYDPIKGCVLIDELNLKKISLESLRNKIAFMSQESFLFSGTLKENILMGRDYDKSRLYKVIEITNLDHAIENMKDGLETIVGERGITLSGGQKQRICLARTLYTKKDIVILDDPISQIDSDTASSIMENLKKEFNDKTILIVSHRISVISGADKIVVMNDNKIADVGSHFYLMDKNPFYKQSYEIQLFKERNE